MPPKPFKPPRPSISSVKKSSKPKRPSTSSTARKSNNSRASGSSAFSLPALDSDSDADLFASQGAGAQRAEEEEEEDAGDTTVIPDEDDSRKESIPPELLSRLLHEFFTHDNTRMGKDASKAVGRYMETFVREAMARAAFMGAESRARTGGIGDGFLEVEDLEKLAPQLLLDF